MTRCAIALPSTLEQAQQVLEDRRYTLPVLKAGGVDVLDHMKEGLWEPDLLVTIRSRRRRAAAEAIGLERGVLRVEATATLAEIAASRAVRERAPVLAQAAGDAATPQVRNAATAAGNLLQRPRCWYYRAEQFHCLKKGGHHCYAFDGENRFHAIFSEGPCYIVHPSNLAPALHVLDGVAHVIGGRRDAIPIADLYHTPDRGVRDEHDLGRREVVTHVTVRPAPASGFYAIKEKQSFDWPLVMAAAAVELDGEEIVAARICAGAVAPVPWPLPAVERALVGVNIEDSAALQAACAIAGDGARPLSNNHYKVRLLPVAVERAVRRAAGREVVA